MRNPFLWLAFSLLPLLPGCISRENISGKMDEILQAIQNANTGAGAYWDGEYSVRYDTTFTPDPAFFAFDVGALDTAEQVFQLGTYEMRFKLVDSGRVVAFLNARPVTLSGWATIRMSERLRFTKLAADSTLPGLNVRRAGDP